MRKGIIGAALLLVRLSAAQDSLHVYYYGGETVEQMNIGGVTVTLSVKDNGKFNQVALYVDNRSPDSVNVIPAGITLHQIAPKEKDLALKSDAEVQKIGGRNAIAHMVSGVGSGLARTRDKIDGRDDSSVDQARLDYDAEARWLAHADELAQKGQTTSLGKSYLRSATVFPGTQQSGVLWFDRDDAFTSGTVHVALGSRKYEFSFPPPDSATTPSNPGQPDKPAAKPTVIKVPAGHPQRADFKHGVLGIEGENWSQSGISGVRIENVAENSSGAAAGLQIGNVITEVDGTPIHSTDDLSAALSQLEPGARVNVTYLFHTNLGWMAKQTSVILARGE